MAASGKVPTLVQFDREQRDRLDVWAKEWADGNRSRAVAEAVNVLLANHAAYLASQRPAIFPGHDRGGARSTADTESQRRGRPLTAGLSEEWNH